MKPNVVFGPFRAAKDKAGNFSVSDSGVYVDGKPVKLDSGISYRDIGDFVDALNTNWARLGKPGRWNVVNESYATIQLVVPNPGDVGIVFLT